MTDGFIIIDKPGNMTSHDVVSYVRRKFDMRRVGHAGTLDPLATGVLIILLGKSTKLFEKFSAFDKAYEATLRLGMSTTTADINGKILSDLPFEGVSLRDVEEAFQKFVGLVSQIPPMVSAIKINGRRLYKLARAGIEVKREPRQVLIEQLKVVDFCAPEVKFFVRCSKGTYVRQIAEDVGRVLGCGGCISQIKRVEVGPFKIEEAVKLEGIHESYIRRWTD